MGKWSEEAKRRHSKIMKERFRDPEYRRKLSESVKIAMNKPEFKKKHAEATKRALANPEVRAKMCKSKTLENNPFWKGGVSVNCKEYTCPICGNVFVGWEIVQPVYCSVICRDVGVQRDRVTDIEQIIMDWLIEQNIHHVFQFPIQLKDYYTIVDFFIPPNICLYVDGDRWYLSSKRDTRRKQQNHDLPKLGFTVIRLLGSAIREGSRPVEILDMV